MLCAIANIDPAASGRLVELAKLTERFGIPPRNVHGHITLATYVGEDEEGFTSSCKAMLSGYGKFPVHYDKIEAWVTTSGVRSLIVAAPRRDHTIAAIQKKISRAWAADLNEWTQEDTWRPHTTLKYVFGVDLEAVAEAMQEEFEPFTAQVDRIEFSRVLEDGYEIMDFIELR